MVLRIPKFNSSDTIFILSFSLYMILSILNKSFFYSFFFEMNKFLMLLCIILLVLYDMRNSTMSKKELIGAFLLSVLAFWDIWRGGRSQSLAIVFLYAFSSRNVSFTKIAKVSLLTSLIMLIIIIGCSQLGIIDDFINSRYTLTGVKFRHYLGFLYVLFGPAILLNIILLYIYIQKEKIKGFEIGVLFAISICMYLATDARLSFLLSVLSLLVAVINKFRKDNFSALKVIPYLLIPSYFIGCITSLLLTLFYTPSNQWWFLLNFMLAQRLSLGQISIREYGINLFGSNVEWLGHGLNQFGKTKVGEYAYLAVDNMYIQILQKHGIIFTIAFLILLTFLMYRLYQKKDNLLLILLAIRAIQFIIDDLALYLCYNTFLLLIGSVLFGRFAPKNDGDSPFITKQLC